MPRFCVNLNNLCNNSSVKSDKFILKLDKNSPELFRNIQQFYCAIRYNWEKVRMLRFVAIFTEHHSTQLRHRFTKKIVQSEYFLKYESLQNERPVTRHSGQCMTYCISIKTNNMCLHHYTLYLEFLCLIAVYPQVLIL